MPTWLLVTLILVGINAVLLTVHLILKKKGW